MTSICMYFQVHQPWRLREYGFFNLGEDHYFNDAANQVILNKVAEKCYLPATRLLLDLILRYGEDFQFTFSISGPAIEQFQKWQPAVLDQFKRLAATGHVEFLAETYYHSLCSLYSETEFREQVRLHAETVYKIFGVWPTAFRNTELIYNNHIAWLASDMGYLAILLEGTEKVLGKNGSPNYLYNPRYSPEIKCFLRNYSLSDDIAFRFSEKDWREYPLTAEKYSRWVANNNAGKGDIVNLFMDFETFGEHQWKETGIFEFMRELPASLRRHGDFRFQTISATARKKKAYGKIDTESPISWADTERDPSAWTGNSMQKEALLGLYELEDAVKERGDPHLLEIWRKLQVSDHFYYMCTKFSKDGDVHNYFSPYNSPHDAYIYYMNILQDFRKKLEIGVRA